MSYLENLHCFLCQPVSGGLSVSALGSVLEVGVGLFLGLTVIQVVGSAGVTTLRRKASNLRDTVNANNLVGQRQSIGQVDAALLKLEIEIGSLSRSLFVLAVILLLVSLFGLVAASVVPDLAFSCTGFYAVALWYTALPVVLFWSSTLVFNRKCRPVKERIARCEEEVLEAI